MNYSAVNHRQNPVGIAPYLHCEADIVRFSPPNRKEKETHAYTHRDYNR
jgi:hypothetical protein